MRAVSVGGTELRFVDRGAGMPLVLAHGFPLDHTMWRAQIEELPGQTRMSAPQVRVIAPDLRGFGRGPVHDEKTTMAQFADDLAALLDGLAIREPIVLCGLSMGGYVALQFWQKHAARLRALILCDTRAAADSPEAAAARRLMADRVLGEGPAPLAETMLPRVVGETTRREHPAIVENVRRMMLAADPRAIAAASRGMAERPDMTASLAQIRCPALLIVGSEDVTSPPAEMRTMAKAIAGAKFVEIPAAGHLSPLENPAAVNAAIAEFLSTLAT